MVSSINTLLDSLVIELFRFGANYCLHLTFLFGLSASLFFENRDLESFLGRVFASIASTTFVFGFAGFWIIPIVFNWWFGAELVYPNVALWELLATLAVSLATFFLLRRHLSPAINVLKDKLTKRTELERNKRTDVRTINDVLPKQLSNYDAAQYIDLSKGVFVGLNDKGKPSYIPLEYWQKSHAQLIGTTGAGKGVAAQILLTQSVAAGEVVFVVDPKNDEWAPHVLRAECERHGKPFYLIDLNSDQYQMDFLASMSAHELEELLIAGFSLAEKGEAADFYRIEDRRAARTIANSLEAGDTLRSLFAGELAQSIANKAAGFFGKLEELALMNSINARGGLDLADVVESGGCVYVIGSMRNSRVIMMQRMLTVRIIQLAERRDRVKTKPLPIAVFLDEFKYHISKPALEGLGAARDKGVHIIMAHQSLADLHDCPADINGNAVQGAVVENANIKIAYQVKDPETAQWMARMSGTILVDDETRKASRTSGLSEVMEGERTIRQAERYFVDENMLLNLPKSCAFVYSGELPFSSYIKPLHAEKHPLELHEAPEQEEQEEFDPLAGLDEELEDLQPEELDPLAGLDEELQPEELDPLAGLDEVK